MSKFIVSLSVSCYTMLICFHIFQLILISFHRKCTKCIKVQFYKQAQSFSFPLLESGNVVIGRNVRDNQHKNPSEKKILSFYWIKLINKFTRKTMLMAIIPWAFFCFILCNTIVLYD